MDELTYSKDVGDQKVKLDSLHVDAGQGEHIHRACILEMDSVWPMTNISADSPSALESDKTGPVLNRCYGGRCGA